MILAVVVGLALVGFAAIAWLVWTTRHDRDRLLELAAFVEDYGHADTFRRWREGRATETPPPLRVNRPAVPEPRTEDHTSWFRVDGDRP